MDLILSEGGLLGVADISVSTAHDCPAEFSRFRTFLIVIGNVVVDNVNIVWKDGFIAAQWSFKV